MIELTMTRYTFDLNKRVTVDVYGKDTEENREKAERAAVLKIKSQLDENDLYCIDTENYTDYEREFEEAV